VPVHGGIIANDGLILVECAEQGMGLAYAFEPLARGRIASGHLCHVLEPYYAEEAGFFLYYPSRAQRSPALQVFIETIRGLIAGDAAVAESAASTVRRKRSSS
jgi:DNA-binding transcriptional LysR family regulator